ncbi:MAG: undecaprenyl-phosphate galactose phosphotransferase WbaP [Acetobacteraceae bacterium]|nr:undecaprenyl-phosphate galactose phosphotransferase WbaP [Acetobacteraceae bacterium]MBV8523831.1 undecaprenyl-phosphate galactose phosphotransferase WbaP [Acetobacteraceae bacterium]
MNRSDILIEGRPRVLAARAASLRALILITADVSAFVLATCTAFVMHMAVRLSPLERAYQQIVSTGVNWPGWATLLVLTVLLTHFGSRGHYTNRIPFWTELHGVVTGVFIAFLCDCFIRVAVYGLTFVFEGVARWLVFAPCILLTRQTARCALRACGLWTLRTLMVGERSAISSARAALLSEPGLGYDLAGIIPLEAISVKQFADPWPGILSEYGAEFVVVGVGAGYPETERAVVLSLARNQVPFALVPALDGLPVTGFRNQYFFSHDVVLLVCRNNLARPLSRFIKSVFDQILAAAALVLLAPLFLVLAWMIRSDGGPALFGHTRIGANGQKFRCLKFRTMVPDADAALQRILSTDPRARAEWHSAHKLRDDPRITRIGMFLRQTSLDELPQLLNVLRGEMSLVGPRPIVDAEIPRYGDNIAYYYEAKPGITGLWQVSGRSNTSYEDRVKLDVWYVRNWTLWHDIAILLKTIPAVLLKKGAV